MGEPLALAMAVITSADAASKMGNGGKALWELRHRGSDFENAQDKVSQRLC